MFKAQKNVILDFEQDFFNGMGHFFCSGCRTLSRILWKKNFYENFYENFSRIFQSQNFERHRNSNFFLTQHRPFLVFSSSNESQHRVLQD
jgi:hypothetical protein